jgi:threonine/homoserine/homoserine lactone efflux protein
VREPVLLFLLAFGLGFVAAIPVGGAQIEMAKRAVAGHGRAAAMVVLGSVSSDVVYGGVALFGIAPFMEWRWVLAAFNAAGAVVLWVFGFLTLRESRKPHDLAAERPALRSRRWAYVTGFSLAISNPQIMLSWLLGVALAKHLGLATPLPRSAKVLFIAGGVLGLGSYLGILGAVVYRVKHFIPAGALRRVYFWLGVTLFLLSLYFVYGAARFFVTGA